MMRRHRDSGCCVGRAILVLTPWGMQFELISYPKGAACERGAKTRLWAPGSR